MNIKSSGNSNSNLKMIKYQSIAPAPSDGKILTPRMLNAPYGVDQTQSVARRNARERNRVKQVNNSFAKLRQHIPQYVINDLTKGGGRGPQKKISKVDTLRIAVEYIRRLQDLVEDINDNSCNENENNSYNSNARADTPLPAQSYSSVKQFYSGNPASPLPAFAETQLEIQQQQQQQLQTLLPNNIINNTYSPLQTQLETVCHSPTSSFNSSMSFDSGHFEATQQLSPNHSSPNKHLQLKFEAFNSFNLHHDDCSPDDEEILDYISLWQDQHV